MQEDTGARRESLSQEGSVASMDRASLNSKTYDLKIKSKHFLIILEELDLASYVQHEGQKNSSILSLLFIDFLKS